MPLFYDVRFWPLDPPKTLNTMCFIGSFQISQFLSAKLYIHICKKCLKFGFKILWVKENTPWGKYISENKFLKFFVYTRIWDVQFLLTYLLGSAIKNLGLFSKSPGDFKMETMDF